MPFTRKRHRPSRGNATALLINPVLLFLYFLKTLTLMAPRLRISPGKSVRRLGHDQAGSPSPGSRQAKSGPVMPQAERVPVWVSHTLQRLLKPSTARRIAPVAHRTPSLAGGPTGDGSRRCSGGQSPLTTAEKKGGSPRGSGSSGESGGGVPRKPGARGANWALRRAKQTPWGFTLRGYAPNRVVDESELGF